MDRLATILTNIFCIEPKPLRWELDDTLFYVTEVAVYPIIITKMKHVSYFPQDSIFQTKYNATKLLTKRQMRYK